MRVMAMRLGRKTTNQTSPKGWLIPLYYYIFDANLSDKGLYGKGS
jgi:hypothetical protein